MPFAGATVDDIDDDALTTTVLIEDPDVGLFATSGGFTDQGGGSYAFAGTADATTVAMRGLTFEPADGRLSPGESETRSDEHPSELHSLMRPSVAVVSLEKK